MKTFLLILLTAFAAIAQQPAKKPAPPPFAIAFGSPVRDSIARYGAPDKRDSDLKTSYYTWKKDGITCTVRYEKNAAVHIHWAMDNFKLTPSEMAKWLYYAKAGEWEEDPAENCLRNGDAVATASNGELTVMTAAEWKRWRDYFNRDDTTWREPK